MNIYLLEREDDEVGYDEYDAFVVVAKSPQQAKAYVRTIHEAQRMYDVWSDKNTVKLIGTTDKYESPKIILGSFNAG